MNTEETALDAWLGFRIAFNNGKQYKVILPKGRAERDFKSMLDRHRFSYKKDGNKFEVNG